MPLERWHRSMHEVLAAISTRPCGVREENEMGRTIILSAAVVVWGSCVLLADQREGSARPAADAYEEAAAMLMEAADAAAAVELGATADRATPHGGAAAEPVIEPEELLADDGLDPTLPADIRRFAAEHRDLVQRHLLMRSEIESQVALARQSRLRGEVRETSFWLDQIRTSALIAKQSEVPGADAFGDFWLLQADLFNIRQLPLDLDSRQRQAIGRLERFIREQISGRLSDSDTRRAVVRDARLALLALYDSRGQSRRARDLYEQIINIDPHLAVTLADSFGYLAHLGEPVDFTVTTHRGQSWSLQQHQGHVVIIHFWSDAFEPSEQVFDALRGAFEQYRDQRLALLSVNVGGPTRTVTGRAAWPTAYVSIEAAQGLHRLGIWALPRFMLLDRHGRLIAVGSSTTMLDQVGALVAEAQAHAAREARP
jgi:tetratricopeptide (TPR) repeat protein